MALHQRILQFSIKLVETHPFSNLDDIFYSEDTMIWLSTHGYAMIDACHIIPFGISQNDRITNGLALCPNLHRAFDRGLISIKEDYTVIVSPYIYEDQDHPYSLDQLQNKQVILPEKVDYFPSQENLRWHRENIFKN